MEIRKRTEERKEKKSMQWVNTSPQLHKTSEGGQRSGMTAEKRENLKFIGKPRIMGIQMKHNQKLLE